MNEITRILADIVDARQQRYGIAQQSGDGVSQDEKLQLWIEVLQARLELAKWQEENPPWVYASSR
jgi:hypothetical protein